MREPQILFSSRFAFNLEAPSGSAPPGGFGPGVERAVTWITHEKHIRPCIAFPRLMGKVYI